MKGQLPGKVTNTRSPKGNFNEKKLSGGDSATVLETENLLEMHSNLGLKEFNRRSLSGFNRSIELKDPSKLHIDEINSDNFWLKETTWESRKNFALKNIMKLTEEKNNTFHTLAYQCRYEQIKKLYSRQKNTKTDSQGEIDKTSYENKEENTSSEITLDQKDVLGLSPLIYAIWGEEDNNDQEKKTSRFILSLFFSVPEDSIEDILKTEKNHKPSLEIKSGTAESKENNQFDLSAIKNELGHAFIHEIFDFNKIKIDENNCIERFWYEEIITNSSDEALSFAILKKGLPVDKFNFKHSRCKYKNNISIFAFALRVKSIQCSTLLFDSLIKFADLKQFLPIIEDEISEYLTFNSELIKLLLENLTTSLEKSMTVNINRIPSSKLVITNGNETAEEKALALFENMIYAKDYMQCKIISSKMRLPGNSGTKESLEFLQRLATSENLLLFKTPLIKLYLESKWAKVWLIILLESFLMWINVVVMLLLNFVYKNNIDLLIIFAVLNTILALFEIFQLYSSYLLQFLEYVNKKYYYLGVRLLAVLFSFWPNFQTLICLLYLIISALFVSDAGIKQILSTLLCFLLFIAIILLAFWAQWEYTPFLMAGNGSVLAVVCFCLVVFYFKKNNSRVLFNFSLRILQLAMLIIVLFTTDKNLGILVLTLMLNITVFMTQSVFIINKNLLTRQFLKDKMMLLLDLLIIIIFSINFYTSSQRDYYIVSSLSLTFAVFNICAVLNYLKQNNFELRGRSKVILKIITTFFSALLIGFNLDDNFPAKIFVIITEIFFMVGFSRPKRISIMKILKNTIKMIFSWRAINASRVGLSVYWFWYTYRDINGPTNRYVFLLLVLMRGLTSFRSFKMTRYYVRLIINSLKEVLPFILIFFYSTMSFGIICSVYNDNDFEDIWMFPYDLNIGAASHESTNDMNYFSFFIATVINVIIMLNLLISILGDSYDRFQLNSTEIDYIEMAQTLVEIESLIAWRRIKNDEKAFLVGIISDEKTKVRKGKVTMEEFTELKNVVESLKINMEEQFKNLVEKSKKAKLILENKVEIGARHSGKSQFDNRSS